MTISNHQYRGAKKRHDRKKEHIDRAEFERMMFEIKNSKVINVYVKGVENDHTPTDFFVVSFNLKEKMTLKAFEEMIFINMRDLI